MYEIYKCGQLIGRTTEPVWIAQTERGICGIDRKHATGILFDGVAYHIAGFPTMDGVEDVTIVYTDLAQYLTWLNESTEKSEAALADQDAMAVDQEYRLACLELGL